MEIMDTILALQLCFIVAFTLADGGMDPKHRGDQLRTVGISEPRQLDDLLDLTPDHQVVKYLEPIESLAQQPQRLVEAADIEATTVTLKQHGLKQRTAVPNIARLNEWKESIESRNRRKREAELSPWNELPAYFIGTFAQFNQMELWLDLVESCSLDEVEIIRIHNVTAEGRHLSIAKLGKVTDSEAGPKPMIWIDAGIHPRETATQPTALYLIYRLLDDYHNGRNKHLIDNIDWYILPNYNPDGFIEVTEGTQPMSRVWRKNKARYPDYNNTGTDDRQVIKIEPCTGVDLNRNFPVGWGQNQEDRVHHCSATFPGPSEASENETRTVMDFLTARKDVLSAYVSVHAFGQLVTGSYTTEERPQDSEEMDRVGQKIAKAVSEKHGRNYTYGIPDLYSGGAADWVNSALNVTYSYTMELRDKYSIPKGKGFFLPEEELIPLGEEVHAGMKVLAEEVLRKWQLPIPDGTPMTASGNVMLFLSLLVGVRFV